MVTEMVVDPGGNVKGVSFVSAKRFVEQRSPHAWAKVIAAMPEQHRTTANEALPVGWYSTASFTSLLRAIDRELGDGTRSAMVEMGRFQADHDLNRFFRVMLRFWSPAILVEKAAQVWDRYHDTGTWTVVRQGEQGVVGSLYGWLGASDLLCASTVSYIGRLFELVGAKTAQVEHTECVARGGKCCQWTVRWS